MYDWVHLAHEMRRIPLLTWFMDICFSVGVFGVGS